MRPLTKAITLVSLLLISSTLVFAQPERYATTQQGKRIQLDGFPLEWKRDLARPLDGSPRLSWSAINAPDGFTACFFWNLTDSCPPAKLLFYPDLNNPHQISSVALAVGEQSALAATQLLDEDSAVSTEVIIGWNDIAVDSLGVYRIGAAALDSCGDTLATALFEGKRYAEAQKVLSPRLFAQFLSIALLLTLYVVMNLRIRKRKSQKESLRQ
jgi:hypothetical protein